MSTTPPPPGRWRTRLFYAGATAGAAALTFLLAALLLNIFERQQEAQQHYVELVKLDEDTVDPAVWGKNFPRQYDSYLRTVDTVRTRHGGSDGFSKLEAHPFLKRLYAGYLFSVDFREERGHAYMLKDQDDTERVKKGKQPGACLHCHSSVIPAYRQLGDGDVLKGFAALNAMDWTEARPQVEHAVSCIDCHDAKTMHLRVTRPAFLIGIQRLAESDEPLPQYPSLERWRRDRRDGESYDVNAMASRQEMRTFVCAQCHVEYYFKGKDTQLTYPWHNGLKVEQIEKYYDDAEFKDWTHAVTGAPVLKAQHPEFELWSQGVHARSGVACADCHMPYKREGAVKVSDHHVRSPLLMVNRACQTCHHFPEEELKARAEAIQDRTLALVQRTEVALDEMMNALVRAQKGGAGGEALAEARRLHRKAQWRLDFVLSENSLGFHAPQETARILAEAIDFARLAELALTRDGSEPE